MRWSLLLSALLFSACATRLLDPADGAAAARDASPATDSSPFAPPPPCTVHDGEAPYAFNSFVEVLQYFTGSWVQCGGVPFGPVDGHVGFEVTGDGRWNFLVVDNGALAAKTGPQSGGTVVYIGVGSDAPQSEAVDLRYDASSMEKGEVLFYFKPRRLAFRGEHGTSYYVDPSRGD